MDDDVETRRAELEAKLWEIGHDHGMPTAEAQAKRQAAMRKIQAELAALPARESAPSGMAVGSVVVGLDRLLGTVTIMPASSYEDERAGHHSSRYGDDEFPWREFAPDP